MLTSSDTAGLNTFRPLQIEEGLVFQRACIGFLGNIGECTCMVNLERATAKSLVLADLGMDKNISTIRDSVGAAVGIQSEQGRI